MQYAALNDTLFLWFASNSTTGSGSDGSAPQAFVRLAGAAAGAAPVLAVTPILMSHSDIPEGVYQVAIPATELNGFAAGSTYAVFCTLAVDGQNPTGFVGSFKLGPILT